MIISLVLAMAKNRAIGRMGELPWNVPTDMNRFRTLTKNRPIIMGSKTFESLPGGKALPSRTNIVLTRDASKRYEGAEVFTDLGEAIKFASTCPGGDEVMVIGGGKVFEEALPLAHRIYLTVIDTEILDADTFFPELDPIRWESKEEGTFAKDAANEYGGTFFTYNRSGKYPVVEPSTGRNEEYRAQLQRILDSGVCPFCPDGETLKEQPILRQNDTWFLKENAHPLANTMYHFLLTPHRHMAGMDELTLEEFAGLLEMRSWLKENYDMTGDAFYCRSGEPLVTGASVSHFHGHIIVPSGLVQVSFGRFAQP